MDLNLTADETQFRDEFRAWLAKHAPKDWEHRRDETVEQHFAFLKTWQRTLYDGGWAGISWPREYGGRGASLMQQVIFWQEMALAGAPPMANVLGLGLVGPTLIAFGTERAEVALPSQNPERGRNLVSGIFRAERRIGPRRTANGSAPRRRPLHRQRTKGLDELRVGLRLVRTGRAHGPGCAQTQGPDGPARRHEDLRASKCVRCGR